MASLALSLPTRQRPSFFPFASSLSLSKRRCLLPSFPVVTSKSAATQAPVARLSSNSQQVIRPSADFPSNIWGDHFGSLPSIELELESYDRQIEVLKKKVHDMLVASSSDNVGKIALIDSICRLGLSHHFEREIAEQLGAIFHAESSIASSMKDPDLYTVALVFRVFRQHGYKMSCARQHTLYFNILLYKLYVMMVFVDESDAFETFLDGSGKFKQSLTKDPKGMLSLFEAAHLSTHGEEILDEALAFTKAHLAKLADQSESHLATQILEALKIPLHKGMPRLKARQYIFFYEEDDLGNCSENYETLLKLAKLDFNRIQAMHQQEINDLMEWSKDINLRSLLPYARDRIVEYHYWSVCVYYEPRYALARKIFVQTVYLLTYLDDTYDAYGTFEELNILTDAMQRWTRDAADQLPADYLKHFYNAYLDLFDELEKDVAREGRSYAVTYNRDLVKEMARCYLVERQWTEDGYVPSFEESLEKAAITTGGLTILTAMSFIGMGEIAGLQEYEWILTEPDIIKAAQLICRLINDIATHKDEEERGYAASPFFCYMKQHKATEMEVVEEFRRRMTSAWKTMNEECMKRPLNVSIEILKRVLNIARAFEVTYAEDVDGFTYGKHRKDDIAAVFIDQVPMAM